MLAAAGTPYRAGAYHKQYGIMPLREAFKLALQSLWANKLRSILTLLGVVIGIASVITVVTLTNGANRFVTAKINSYGASVGNDQQEAATFMTLDEYLAFQRRKDITIDDYRAVVADCKGCEVGGGTTTGNVVNGTSSTTIRRYGAGPGRCLRSPT